MCQVPVCDNHISDKYHSDNQCPASGGVQQYRQYSKYRVSYQSGNRPRKLEYENSVKEYFKHFTTIIIIIVY